MECFEIIQGFQVSASTLQFHTSDDITAVPGMAHDRQSLDMFISSANDRDRVRVWEGPENSIMPYYVENLIAARVADGKSEVSPARLDNDSETNLLLRELHSVSARYATNEASWVKLSWEVI